MKLLAVIASVFFGLGALPADAATFSVSSTADAWDINPGDGVCNDGAGKCPLRAAIMEANALAGHDTLALNGVTHYLSPTFSGAGEDGCKLGDLDIKGHLTFTTRFGAMATIDGGGVGDRVIHVFNGSIVSMTSLRIQNGTAGADGGGGIRNDGNLTMTRSEVTGNSAWGPGGGIDNGEGATLTFTEGTIRDNNAQQVQNATYESRGGGLHVRGAGTVFIDFSTVSGNQASSGGGVANTSDESTIVINNTTVADNAAYGNGEGGGIFGLGTSGGDRLSAVQLTNVTVSGNTAHWRGGGIAIYNLQLGLINSTVTDNWIPNSAAYSYPSGLAHRGSNDRSGVWIVNTMIADNKGDEDIECEGLIFSLGHNIDDDGTCGLTAPTDQQVPFSALLLGSLQYNGGPTKTHELLAGSPAIDAADPAWCPSIDQRKHARPSGAGCDIGAYEAGTKTTLTGKVFEVDGFARSSGDGFTACMKFAPSGDFVLGGFGSGTWREEILDERTLAFDGVTQDQRRVRLTLDGAATLDGQIDATAFDSRGVEYEIVGFENPACEDSHR